MDTNVEVSIVLGLPIVVVKNAVHSDPLDLAEKIGQAVNEAFIEDNRNTYFSLSDENRESAANAFAVVDDILEGRKTFDELIKDID